MMRIGGRTYEVDWGHLLVATFIVIVCVWYLFDARSVSLHPNNLLLVQPATFFAILLYLLVLPQCVRRVPEGPGEPSAAAPEEDAGPAAGASTLPELLRVAALSAAFGFFVFSLETIGFDIATWLFTTVGLFICGERRPLTLALFPPVFTVAIVYGYQALVPYPIVTTVL